MVKSYKILVFSFCFFSLNIYSQQIICFGTTRTYAVDLVDGPTGTLGSTYQWNVNESSFAGTIVDQGTNSVSINWGTTPVGNYTIEVTEINASCSGVPVTLSVTIKANPIVTTADAAVCDGLSASISAVVHPSSASNVFTWTYPTGATNPGDLSSFLANVAGDYVVTVKDVDGCISSAATAKLIVNPLPSAMITEGGPTTICEGGDVLLSAPSGLSNYSWKRGGVDIISATSSTYLAKVSGNYTVTTTDAIGCVNTTSTTTQVTVNPLPIITVSLSGPTEFCEGGNVNLTASSTGIGSIFQWANTAGNIGGQTANTYIAASESGYYVKVSDTNNCNSTSNVIPIIVHPNPDAAIAYVAPIAFCAGDNVILSVASVSGYTYQWANSDGVIVGETNATYTASESSDYSVQVIDNNYGTLCTSTTATPIKVVKKDLPVTSPIQY